MPSADVRNAYLARLRAALERHKRYPRRAQLRGDEGTAVLRFVVDREGRVLSFRLDRSSGHAALDDATAEMLRRATPLPPLPAAVGAPQLEVVLPVTFALE